MDAHGQAERRTLTRRLKLTAVALACSLVALIVATFFLVQQAQLVRAAMVRQTALTAWLSHFQRILILLADAESGQRGYLLTERDQYLVVYRQAVQELPRVLQTLDRVPIEDPVLHGRVANIRRQAALKLAELADTLRLHDTVSHAAALALVQTDSGQRYMDDLRADVNTATAIIRTTRNSLNDKVVSGSLATERLAVIAVSALIVTLLLAALEIASLMAARSRYERVLATREQFIQGITDNVPVRLAYFDAQQRFQFVNQLLCDRLGSPREALIGKSLHELADIARGPAAALTRPLELALRGQSQRLEYADVLGSQTRHIQTHLIPDVASGGKVRGVFGVGLDVSQEVIARRELSRQAATLEAIVDAIPAMVGVCDTDLRFQLVNRAYQGWRGMSSQELVGRNLRDVLSAAEFERSYPWIQRALGGETVSYEIERPLDAEARHLSITYIPLRLGDGSVGGFIGMVQDITQHREENMRLVLLAERDPLTGLLNKAGFESYLGKQVAQGKGGTLAVLYIDLDHFKPINDAHGHTIGDEVLRQFAVRLHSVVRPTDAVARLGGDEFAVVLAGIREAENAGVVADKIVELARQPIQVGDLVLNIGASIGAAVDANSDGGWKGLVARADAMSYRAKAEGRGRRALAPAATPVTPVPIRGQVMPR